MVGSVEELQARGEALHGAVSSLPSEVLTPDCRARLLKVVQAERNFVERLASNGASPIARAHLCRYPRVLVMSRIVSLASKLTNSNLCTTFLSLTRLELSRIPRIESIFYPSVG